MRSPHYVARLPNSFQRATPLHETMTNQIITLFVSLIHLKTHSLLLEIHFRSLAVHSIRYEPTKPKTNQVGWWVGGLNVKLSPNQSTDSGVALLLVGGRKQEELDLCQNHTCMSQFMAQSYQQIKSSNNNASGKLPN